MTMEDIELHTYDSALDSNEDVAVSNDTTAVDGVCGHVDSSAEHAVNTIGKVAASAVLATSLAAVLSEPPRADLVSLPEPTPLVQIYNPYADDVEPAENDEDDAESTRRRRILKLLRVLAVALLLTGCILFGALKGCASCTALLPPATQEQDDDEESAKEDVSQEAASLMFPVIARS